MANDNRKETNMIQFGPLGYIPPNLRHNDGTVRKLNENFLRIEIELEDFAKEIGKLKNRITQLEAQIRRQ